MNIYALFFCLLVVGNQQPYCDFAKSAGLHPTAVWHQTAEGCEQAAQADFRFGGSHSDPGADGKFTIKINGNKAWYECRLVPADPAPTYVTFSCRDGVPCTAAYNSAFHTLSECSHTANRDAAYQSDNVWANITPRGGRYYVPANDHQWFECRVEHLPIPVTARNTEPAPPVKLNLPVATDPPTPTQGEHP